MISVVVSTYNSPAFLERVLWGYYAQTERRFELLIADDGSTDETKELVDRIRMATSMDIRHFWHEDVGFRKTRICNRAFSEAKYDYILCADGDCIPRADLIESHLRYAKPGRFLCGTAIRLSRQVTHAIDRESILSGRAFNVDWLMQNGMPFDRYLMRLLFPQWFQPIANRYLCSKPQFNGGNSSAWKSDILRVNGYDENLTYGGEDWELGFRMHHAGVQPVKVRCSAHCIHLDHDRPYATEERRQATRQAKLKTLQTRASYTMNGIIKQPALDPAMLFEPSHGKVGSLAGLDAIEIAR